MAGHQPDEDVTSSRWTQRAACRHEDPELFFPPGREEPGHPQTRAAKEVCRRCAVVEDCLAYALRTRQPDGVWGGLTTAERRQQRRGTAPRRRGPTTGEAS